MEMHLLLPVGILLVAGFFAAAWFRHSRPVRLFHGKERISPSA
jgi:hypothetical protein